MEKRIENLKVKKNIKLNSDSFVLVLESEKGIPAILPGQFAQLKVDRTPEVFLRRPFSIHDVDVVDSTISIFIKIIGKGTQALSDLKVGDLIDTIYPLGNSFSKPFGDRVLFVGGGSGVAPFLFFAKELNKIGLFPDILLGARSAEQIVLTHEFNKYGKVLITTEDGSLGEKGFVTNHSALNSGKPAYDFIYTCGPEPMMKAIGSLAMSYNISCEASLENLMACGFGVCLCCVTPTIEGNLCVCTEGPVFNVNHLKW